MQSRRAEVAQRSLEFGELAPAFNAMQQVLSWNTIYDASQDRVITPVSRPWANGWGGWVLFDWDTYFAAYMFSLFNKNLAFANAIAITRSITKDGFIPNFASPGLKTDDRSRPPVGSMIVREIYRRHPEKWFLAEVYAELLSWNRWWPENRDKNGFLCWGSNPQPNDTSTNTYNSAILESGLNNSPMYDGVPYDAQAHVIELADVGLMSFYIADCQALAEIAQLLGHAADARELS